MLKTKSGFTIVELLIVIVVIAILAAISIVAYNGIQNRSYASSIQADLASFSKKIEIAKIDSSDGLYPVVLTQPLGVSFSRSAYKADRNNLYYVVSPDRTQYALGGVSKAGDAQGYVVLNGSVQANSAVSDVTVRGLVGASASQVAYSWNSSVGTWQSWVN